MKDRDVILNAFKSAKLSRRDAGAALMGAGLSAVAAGSLIERAIGEAVAQEPKTGGTLRVASTDSHAGDTIDPAKIIQNIDIIRSGIIYETLVDYVPGTGLVPSLATSWESNNDATEWRFVLRDGVEFHNGKTMTASDVVASFNRHLDPDIASPANAYLGDVESFAADGDGTLVVRMKQPNADIPYLFSEYHFTAQPEGDNDYTTGAVGTGAWQLQDFEPGIVATFVRNPNYWKSGLPYIDEIETFGIPDNASRVNALLAGEADMIVQLDPQLIGSVEADANGRVLSQPGGAHPTYPMLANTAPYSDNNVRLALKHAVDRERMLELAFGGFGVVGRDHPIPQHDPFFAADVEPLAHDPDKVAYYLKQAGMEGASFELVASDANFGGANASVVMAELMNESGANVTVKKVPSDGYWSAIWMQAPWCGSSWYGRPTADLMLSIAYITGGAWNESFWSNEKFDSLVLEARKATDTALRTELYRECQILMRDEGSTVTPVFTNWMDGYSARVRNFNGHPYGFLGWMKWSEVWLADASA